MSETRDGWECDGCGNGWCMAEGEIPAQLACIGRDGILCGTYRYMGQCEACRREDAQEALEAMQ